jgi:hypothetical protein
VQGSFDFPMFSVAEFITSNSRSAGISIWTAMAADVGSSEQSSLWLDLSPAPSPPESARDFANAAAAQTALNFGQSVMLPWLPPDSFFAATSSSALLGLSNGGSRDSSGGLESADVQPSAETPEPAAFVIGALALLAAKILRRRE